ncbi:signal recognition particle subunit SRP72 isoform X2 [Lampetra planeri]
MAASVAPALWGEVKRSGDPGRTLRILNKILQDSKEDVTALHCKVVCLIQQGNFKEALHLINNNSKLLTADVIAFEKAYCEYRLNRIDGALKTIESASQQTNKLKELLGQVLYRLERYEDCLAVYRDLIRNSQDDYDEERMTNLSAAYAAVAMWTDSAACDNDFGFAEESYEQCYNMACALLGQGKLLEAMQTLGKAQELCRQSLSEDPDITEDDIQMELATIHCQEAFIHQKLGRHEEALHLYSQVVKSRPSDIGLLAVAANNIVTINKDQNVFDSKKKIKLTLAEGVENKLTKLQLQALSFNRALLCMHTSQDFCNQHGDSIPEIEFTIAQLYLCQGHFAKACEKLKSIEKFRFCPGIVSALVTLHTHEENIDEAIDILNGAIDWYKKHEPHSTVHLRLMREAAQFKLRHGRQKDAVNDLEQLWRQDPLDVKNLAQLISAYSQVDARKAKELSQHLPAVDATALHVDVDALESPHGLAFVRRKAVRQAATAAAETQKQHVKEQRQGELKKKKKKKGKLPKNCEELTEGGPDPERWLPMRERSYYRGRKKSKKKEGAVGRGTQGATAGAMAELDASKRLASPPASPQPGAASSASEPVPSRQQKLTAAAAAATASKKKAKKKKGKSNW